MPLDKKNISISFGQGIDTKTDPNQVIPGTLTSLQNATLSENLTIKKRNGFQSLVSGLTLPNTSAIQAKLGTFNNELCLMDGKSFFTFNPATSSLNKIDSLIAAIPKVSIVDRNYFSDYCPDSAYNPIFGTSLFVWSSSGINTSPISNSYINGSNNFTLTSNYRLQATNTNYKLVGPNQAAILSGQIPSLSRARAFSVGPTFFITGVNEASSSLNYYYFNASTTNFNPNGTSGTLGFVTTSYQPLNQNPVYPRYDGFVTSSALFISYFSAASTAIETAGVTTLGQILNSSGHLGLADASGGLAVFGINQNHFTVAFDGIGLAKWFYQSTSSLININSNSSSAMSSSGSWPLPASTSRSGIYPTVASSGNADGSTIPYPPCNYPLQFTGTAGSTGVNANIYWQNFNTYSPVPSSGNGLASWPIPARSDFISSISVSNGVLGSTSIVMRSVGLASKAFSYNGNDFLLAAYGPNTQFVSTPDRLEPTYFLIAPQASNSVVGKLAFQNGGGYDFIDSVLKSPAGNGVVDLGLPLPQINQISQSVFQTVYLFKNAASIPVGQSNDFIPLNFGVNSASFDLNSQNAFVSKQVGPGLSVAGGYLATYDGNAITENNFHLFPEDIRTVVAKYASNIIGGGTVGNAYLGSSLAQTYSYIFYYETEDAQNNIIRSAISKTYTAAITAGSSAIVYLDIPTLRVTNHKQVSIKVFRNAPSVDTTTFHDLLPNTPLYSSTGSDSIFLVDNTPDSSLLGNPTLYTTGGILEDTATPAPWALSTYKTRVMMTDSENRTNLWYSKEVIPGTPVEMTDLQILQFTNRWGDLNAHIEMDDKEILFFANQNIGAIFYMTGEGPDATGGNNDFSQPIFITDSVSTTNQNSIVRVPDGVMFQSNKGIWILGRDLSVNYIGAPVEAYNSQTVTSAQIIPKSTRVQFTLDNGNVLVWDYYQKQWSVFTGINAVSSVLFQGLFTYLQQYQASQKAVVAQETPGIYSDLGKPIAINLSLGWLSFSGFQGYQRLYKIYLKGQYLSPHILNVSLAYDFNPGVLQTARINSNYLASSAFGMDNFTYGAGSPYGGSYPNEQNRINPKVQKCQSIQISIAESMDPQNAAALGAGSILEAIGCVIGAKLTYPKLPASRSVT